MKTFKELLIELEACSNARTWAGDMSIEEVVEKCHRGDWLLWLAKRININIRTLTLAKGRCAETVIHLMKDERSKNAVSVAIAFGQDNANNNELAYAADAAFATAADAAFATAAAAYAAADDAAAYAAYAAAAAAAAADDAAAVAAYTAAAVSAAAAAAAAFAADAKTNNQLATSDICRMYIGDEIIKKVNLLLQK